jgi:glutaminyl-tRNA synthetase
MEAVNNPEDPSAGTRQVPFSRELWIEQDDFREEPPPKYFRLSPGREVRLRYAYIIKCTSTVKDDAGNVVELRCTYDPGTKSGMPGANRKVKATLHWVSAPHAVDAEVRLYDRLFVSEDPEAGDGDFIGNLNPNALERLEHAKLEPSLASAEVGSRWQFERQGYFAVDPDSQPGAPIFNRTVTLRDAWANIQSQGPK